MRILGCPGQGSQSKGFLEAFIDNTPGFMEELERLSSFCNRDLVALGSIAEEEVIKDTANAQPLIVAASIATYRTLLSQIEFDAVVGHSVGEFAAAAIAGVLSDEDAMRLVAVRADAMAKAAKLEETSMAAILGGEIGEIEAKLATLNLSAANYNGAGQLVAAGLKSDIAELVASPPEKSRVIELKVAGAFHTSFMLSAVEELALAASSVEAKNPKLRLWSNFDGEECLQGQDFLDSLVKQVARPVRWDKCMESMSMHAAEHGSLEFVELPPAGALAGLVKRGIQGSKTLAFKDPSDLEKIGATS